MSDSSVTSPKPPPPGDDVNPAAKVGFNEKLAYAGGGVTSMVSVMIFNQLVTPIFQITLGISPILIGLLNSITRLWDAVTDPFFANWSDNTRGRHGRRKPFIFWGGIGTSLIFPFIWTPVTGWNEMTLFVYLVVMVLCFQTTQSAFSVAYDALGMEMTKDYNERTRIFAFRAYLPPVFSLGSQWVYRFIQSDFFDGPMQGMRYLAFSMGVIMLLCSLAPVFFTRERAPRHLTERKRVPFLTSIRHTLSNGPFLVIVSMIVFGQLASNIFAQMGIYANIYVLSDGDTKVGATLTGYVAVVYFFVMMTSIHLGSVLSERFSKHGVVIGAAVLTVCSGLLKFVLYNPDYPYLILLAPLFSAPGGAVGSYMISSMMADVATYDEWKNGTRREGMFTAAAGWLYKVSFSLAGVLGGMVLVLIGFDEQLGGAQSEFTKDWLVYGMVIGTTTPGVITIVAMLFYPLNKEKMDHYVAEIREREKEEADAS